MPKLCTFFALRLVGWLGGRPVWPVNMLKSVQIKCICWVLQFRDYIPSFNQIGWKMPKLCMFFTFRLVGLLGGRLVSILKSLQIKYIWWVLPFKDYIPSFTQIGWKMPKLCMFFTFRLVGWLGRLGWSDHDIRIRCKAAYPSTTSLQIWSKLVKAFKS